MFSIFAEKIARTFIRAIVVYGIIPAPSCARRSAHRHSEGEALGGETENLLQIKQFSILRISKRVRNKFMYITTHLIDFITIILGRDEGILRHSFDYFLVIVIQQYPSAQVTSISLPLGSVTSHSYS